MGKSPQSKKLLTDNERMEIQLRQLREELEKEKQDRQSKAWSSNSYWRSGGSGNLRDGSYKPAPKKKGAKKPARQSTSRQSASRQSVEATVKPQDKPWSVYDATTWKVPTFSKEEGSAVEPDTGSAAAAGPVGDSLLDGEVDEEANRLAFQAALQEWRNGGKKDEPAGEEEKENKNKSAPAAVSTSTATATATASTEPPSPSKQTADMAIGTPPTEKKSSDPSEVKIVYGAVRRTPGTAVSYADRVLQKRRAEQAAAKAKEDEVAK